MFTNFKELEAYVLSHKNKKRIVLANAHDEPALSAVVNAHRRGVVDGTLLGKKDEILALLREMNEDPAEYEIVDFDGPELDAAKAAVQLVREGKADIPMKGILQTSSFAKAILNRETGLIPASGRRLVSQCGIFEYEGRFMMITDAGTLVRTRVSEVSIVGRNTQGVILIRTAEDENVVGLQRVAEPVDDEELDAIDGSAAEGDDDIAPEADTDDDIAEDEE